MKRILLLTLLGFANTYSAERNTPGATEQSQKPRFKLTLPITSRTLKTSNETPEETIKRMQEYQAKQRALQEAKREKYLNELITYLNILLKEIMHYGGEDLLPQEFVTYYRYDDGTIGYEINTNAFKQLDYSNQENIIKIITKAHDTTLNKLPKNPRVKWPVNNDEDYDTDSTDEWEDTDWDKQQDLEEWYTPDQLPAEAMFEMHEWPAPFGTKNTKSTERGGPTKYWYKNRNLSPKTEAAFKNRQMVRRFQTPPTTPEDQAVLEEMKREGTNLDKKSNTQERHHTLEQLRRIYPELFNK